MFRLVESLECRALQNYGRVLLPCLPLVGKCRQLRFRGVGNSIMLAANQISVAGYSAQQSSHFLGRLNFSSHLRLAFPNSAAHKTLRFRISDRGIGLSSSYIGSYNRYFSSSAPVVIKKNDHVCMRGGKSSGIASTFKMFNKPWRRKKPLDARSKCLDDEVGVAVTEQPKQKADSGVTVPSNKDGVDSTSAFTSNNHPAKTKVKRKQQFKSKNVGDNITNAVAHSDALQAKGSKKNSKAKKSIHGKSGKPSQVLENNPDGITVKEVGNSSTSTKKQSKKTTRNSTRKGKPVEKLSVAKKSDVAIVKPKMSAGRVLSNNESQQKQKLQNVDEINNHVLGELKPLYPPAGKSVVVVESVTKAKVIQGYLGDMYEVLPSYGHVRDLAARSGSVRPVDDFSMVWEVPSAAWTHLKSIKVALSGAQNLILASDPDREGEAIAWHIIEMLQQQDALHEGFTIARVVFHEITESSIKTALQSPRHIDVNLVNAYLARRALDYLIGFNISPLLWRKLPGCQSAGRVQSAALSLICDREMEIDEFKPQEYWSVGVEFKKELSDPSSLPSSLTHFGSQKLNQRSISSGAEAKDIENKITSLSFMVVDSKRKTIQKRPSPPYITSTLQQDAANRFQFTAIYTMKLAQKLYEGVQLSDGNATGLITYMRTDGLHVSNEAVTEIHSFVKERYGQEFASESARKYFKKVKNAQEAHEAIRPTDIRRLPSMLVGILDDDSLKLYSLIWSRTMSSQMEPASIDQIHLDIGIPDQSVTLRCSSSRVGFLGYRAVFKDIEAEALQNNESEGNDGEAFEVLDSLKVGDPLHLDKVEIKQHHTQPPLHYSEASLVKKLEELGIGRPSTYASTLKVLQDRNYVSVKNRVLHPEFRGRMVSTFLSHHFSEIADYSFTADMETELDNVSAGTTEWKGLLRDYWTRFSLFCNRASNVHIHQIEKMLEKTFGEFLFSSFPNKSRTCPSCMEGTLVFKVSRFGEGYFIGCDQHPQCKYIARTIYGGGGDDDDVDVPSRNNTTTVEEPKLLGLNPGSSEKVLLKNGPYGFYVQLGEDRKGYVPKRASVAQIKNVDSITLEAALELLRFPLTLGNHPEDGKPVVLKLAKNGFCIRHRSTIASVPKNVKPNNIDMDKALEILVRNGVKRFGRPKNKPMLEEVVEAM